MAACTGPCRAAVACRLRPRPFLSQLSVHGQVLVYLYGMLSLWCVC